MYFDVDLVNYLGADLVDFGAFCLLGTFSFVIMSNFQVETYLNESTRHSLFTLSQFTIF